MKKSSTADTHFQIHFRVRLEPTCDLLVQLGGGLGLLATDAQVVGQEHAQTENQPGPLDLKSATQPRLWHQQAAVNDLLVNAPLRVSKRHQLLYSRKVHCRARPIGRGKVANYLDKGLLRHRTAPCLRSVLGIQPDQAFHGEIGVSLHLRKMRANQFAVTGLSDEWVKVGRYAADRNLPAGERLFQFPVRVAGDVNFFKFVQTGVSARWTPV